MNKAQLEALAVTFGIDPKGTVAQLQEALDANPGYQKYLVVENKLAETLADNAELTDQVKKNTEAAAKWQKANEETEGALTELKGDLATANKQLAEKTSELDAVNEILAKKEEYILVLQANTATEAEDVKQVFTDKNGKRFHVTVPDFRFKGVLYSTEDAIINHTDVLQELADTQSFILKQL